jgi:3-oxoacyl-[acyl-carrier protein] reductase
VTILTLGAGGMSKPFTGIKVTHQECDVRSLNAVVDTLDVYNPSTVILTAGVSNPGPIERASFEEEITTNLLGAFNVAQACVWSGVEKLIFIASVAGLHGKPNHAAYSASKAGVISLVQSLAQEGQIQAFAISPGRCHTPLREKDYPGEDARTRLQPSHINAIVQDILADRYESGDNIVIRMSGHDVLPIEIDRNLYWKKSLKIGEPVVC